MKNTALRRTWVLVGASALALLTGCQSAYVTQRDTPLFVECTGGAEIARIPAQHSGERDAGALCDHDTWREEVLHCTRTAVTYRGKQGFVENQDVSLVNYLHPALDDGESKAQAIGQARQEAHRPSPTIESNGHAN